MQPWSNRAVEEANLFNPAFCATLLAKTVEEYGKKTQSPFPFVLSFLVLPIVLHQATRGALPSSTITSLLPWVQDNREHLINFALRVTRLSSITREAILFGVSHQTLALDGNGDLLVGSKRKTPTERRTGLFPRRCAIAWIGPASSAAGSPLVVPRLPIYSAWGVAP
jgi:Family of unknown function (DUF6521)